MPPVIKLALAQIKPRKGEYSANLARIGEILVQAGRLEPRPDVVHFAETALTGYFVEGGVRDLAVTAGTMAKDLGDAYRSAGGEGPIDAVIGFYEVWENNLYNSAMYVTVGPEEPAIWHVHRKNFLPTYGLFDEERFVERGHEVRAFDAPWGRAALLVCEDAWHSLTGTLVALDGAEVIFVSSAAPARGVWPRQDDVPGPASQARWERLIRDIAEEHGVYVSFANLTGNEGGKMFPGGSMVAGPKGEVRARAPVWQEALLPVAMDLADLTRVRADMPLLSDLRTVLPHLRRTLDEIEREVPSLPEYDPPDEGRGEPVVAPRDESGSGPLCVVRGDGDAESDGPPPLEIDPELVKRWLVTFLRDEMEQRGFRRGIVAISGGVDSAVTAFLAAEALGPRNVMGLRLPYKMSSAESLEHAQLVIDQLGIESRTIEISSAVDAYLANEPDASPTRRGNVMARMRMISLFDLSARYEAIPLGTGNKTERLFGYFTWHADDTPPLNPLGDLYKTQVWALARHLKVPSVIVEKPASADLIKGQTDEGDFGISYQKADQILNWMLSGYAPSELVARGFDATEVELVRKRLESTHWKRRLSTVAMLSPTAIGESYLRPVDY
jgi:NAD+ synthase (glutamine-hydrolysing)